MAVCHDGYANNVDIEGEECGGDWLYDGYANNVDKEGEECAGDWLYAGD